MRDPWLYCATVLVATPLVVWASIETVKNGTTDAGVGTYLIAIFVVPTAVAVVLGLIARQPARRIAATAAAALAGVVAFVIYIAYMVAQSGILS